MKKVFSLVAVALLTVSFLFTSCREGGAPESQEAPATEAPAQEAAPVQEAAPAAPAADSTGAQQAQ